MSKANVRAQRPDGTPKPDELFVLTALREEDGHYRFTIRWLLGATNDPERQANDLPRLGDQFEVRIQRLTGDYLQQDGRTWAATEYAFVKEPVPFAMIDPPRLAEDIPGYEPKGAQQWLAATKPVAPVDPFVDPTTDGLRTDDGSQAMGVIHLLEHTDKTAVAFRMAQLLAHSARPSAAGLFGQAQLVGQDAETIVQQAAIDLALLMVDGRPRPNEVVTKLEGRVTALDQGVGLAKSETAQAAQWLRLGLMAAIASDRNALEVARKVRDDTERVRSQLRLRCLQGGRMIDFWAEGNNPAPPDKDRGRQWTAADLLGLGLDVGRFSRADVEGWLKLAHASADGIVVEVRHIPAISEAQPVPSLSDSQGKDVPFGRLFYEGATLAYKNGTALLAPKDIRRALDRGSSCPPPPPSAAFVNYDLVRNWVDPDKLNEHVDAASGTALSYGTGDGRVELLIGEPRAPDNAPHSVMGFNIYGVWEGASPATDRWFAGDEPRSLAELKPWLITRRYSRLRDLDGALPGSGGSTHVNVVAEHQDPAWHPAMLRVASIEDRTDDDMRAGAAELPYVLKPGMSVWSHDLRQGMGTGAHAMRIGWDPAAPIATRWTPYYWRGDDPDMPSGRTRPQRYRFWATSVDGLDQESAPIAVATADKDAGETETFLFTPRHRTQLPFPPQSGAGSEEVEDALDAADAGDAMRILVSKDRRKIEIEFAVPREFHLGGRDLADAESRRIDPATLRAKAVLFRRRLVRRVDETAQAKARGLLEADPTLSSPAWAAALKDLIDQGWSQYASADISAPLDGKSCVQLFALDHIDRGFEYRALAGFYIADEFRNFWYPTVSARTVQATVQVDGRFELVIDKRPEAVSIGGVGVTQILHVPNHAAPRSARPSESSAAWAKPVLPPPGVDRDLVLMKLLANPVDETPDPDEPPPTDDLAEWKAEGLNLAQAHMAHAAVLRTDFGAAKPDAEQRALVRRLLAHELKQRNRGIRQHGLVGFRGVMRLSWTYAPLAESPPKPPADPAADSEAEATQFRIFMARAPKHTHGTEPAALMLEIVSNAGSTYKVKPVKVDGELRALLTSNTQPTLLAMRGSGAPGYAAGLAFSGSSADVIDTVELKPLVPGLKLPSTPGTVCHVYLAAPVADIPNAHFENEAKHACYLPIGGGPEEGIAWWIASVSAQEVLSPHKDWPRTFQIFHPSVRVQAPSAPVVRSVLNKDEPILEKTVPQYWRPAKLTDATAPFEARLFVLWNKEEFPAGSFVEIDREYQRVAEANVLLLNAAIPDEWNAIKGIEATPDTISIPRKWVRDAAKRWLLGEVVEPDPATKPPGIPFVSVHSRPLTKETGLKMVEPLPGSGNSHPALVDYFAWDEFSLMESDTEYRYRIRVAQEVAPDAPPDWRYLRSEWSSFSPFKIPVRPELQVKAVAPAQRPNGLHPPAVEFTFRTTQQAGAETHYRVLVQRKVRAALLETTEDTGDPFVAWRDVGSIVELEPGKVDEVKLRDEEIERDRLDVPLALQYRMRVVHYALTNEGERLLRKAPGEPIPVSADIPPPAGQPAQEVVRLLGFDIE